MPTPTYKTPPMLWLRTAFNKITGQKTALDMFSQAEKSYLSPELQRVLAATPAERTEGGVAGNYTGRAPRLPFWLSPGKTIVRNDVGPQDLDYATLHEGLHAFDQAALSGEGSNRVAPMISSQLAEQLSKLYYGGNYTGQTLPQDEYFATLGALVDRGDITPTPEMESVYRPIIKRKVKAATIQMSAPSLKKANRA